MYKTHTHTHISFILQILKKNDYVLFVYKFAKLCKVKIHYLKKTFTNAN